jgi:hypothetical protein
LGALTHKTRSTMNNYIQQAQRVLKLYGSITVTIYPNREYDYPEKYIFDNLSEALELISYHYQSVNDDISVN